MKDDTISRAAAVKALEETKQSDPFNRYEYQNIGIDWSIDAIKALPPAQLAQDLPKGCTDTISREAAIELVCKEGTRLERNGTVAMAEIKQWCVDLLESLPSAQPERKTGKWVKYDGDWFKTMFKCSECGAMIDINEKYRNFFCYHCGADMRGEQDG